MGGQGFQQKATNNREIYSPFFYILYLYEKK